MDLRRVMREELARRRARNRYYSMRVFARALGTHHATLCGVLKGRRRLTPRAIRLLGERLGLAPSDLTQACVTENARCIAALVSRPGFRPDSRWLAVMSGLPVDDVNVALQELLRTRRLRTLSASTWIMEEY